MKAYVEIRLFASLKARAPQNAEHFPISPGDTVGDIVDALAIPFEDAKLIFINSVKGGLTTSLKDGDRVAIFPPVGGG